MVKPELKYPNILTKLGNISGGRSEKAPDNLGATVMFGQVVNVDLSQLSGSVHISEATALVKELLQFSNNCVLNAYCWVSNGYVRCKLKSVNKTAGTVITNFDPSGDGDMHISTQGGWLDVTVSLANTYGAVFYINTDYFDANQLPYPGMDAQKVDVVLRFACSTGDVLNNLTQYASGELRYTNMSYFDPSDPRYQTCLDYATGYGVVCGRTLTFTNIDDFLTNFNGGGDNPYETGDPDAPPQENDPSGPGGGEGEYDPSSDPIDFPSLPTGGPLSSGAIKAFLVSAPIMTQVFTKLWNTSIFDIANWQKLLEAPLDSLVELECIPVTPTAGTAASIKLGNFDTETTAPVITNQYITIDCGSIQVKRFWGSALDYEPYTKSEIFLPFIGVKQIHTDDIMNSTVHVKYNIDILTGNLTAQIKCGQSVLYKFEGNCKSTVPVSARVMDALHNFIVGNMGIALASTPAGVATATITAAVNVAMSKTKVTRSGNISGVTGILDDFVPYLIIHRPVQSLPQNFKAQKGYPSNITALLSNLTGYTEVEYVHLTGITGATDTELQEIEDLLKRGVII